ncbi:globin-coupled sensor protein [Natronobeatus ordinarius]|uniref:globin-coupled sensor protein n=1 Tax=Natronobeatus ordinarius TaxID=2963433 RepID=UPI0031F332E6
MTIFGDGELNQHVDPDALLDDIDLDADEIAWRKAFIGFDDEDERRLSNLEPLFRDRQNEIADDFYENLTHHDGTLEVIGRSPKGIEALKQTQRAYLVSLATGEYDEEYFRNRARIGKLHEILDMPMKYYVGQYGVYYDLILSEIDERVQTRTVDAIEEWVDEEMDASDDSFQSRIVDRFRGFTDEGEDEEGGLDPSLERAVREAIHDGMADVLAVLRIVNLDLQVAADTYYESYTQKLDREVERRKALAYGVRRDVHEPIEELDRASMSVAESAQEINDLAASQADDTHAITDEIESLSASIEEIAATADQVKEVGDRAESLAEDGVEQADAALEELAAVEEVTAELTDAVSRLEARTKAIDDVIDHVNDLTERTKVLAVNATVESRRGDATQETLEVIATQVRSFAEEAAQDLTDIETEVTGIKSVTAETVETVEETTDRLDQGTERVETAIADLDQIHDAVSEVTYGIEEVAVAAASQATSAEAIHATAERSSRTADRVSAETESVAAATEEQTANLSEIARTLEKLTSVEDVKRRPVYER